MFTGLVRFRSALHERASQGRAGALRLTLERPAAWTDLRIGDSVAVHGCCLTVVVLDADTMTFEAGAETLARTRLAEFAAGDAFHVEQAVRAGDRLDGHVVTGHVDGLAQLTQRHDVTGGRRLEFRVDASLAAMLPEKGSVCVDGISLTVASDRPEGFVVELIPETLAVTELERLELGDSVHVEVDPLARYAAHWLKSTQGAVHDR